MPFLHNIRTVAKYEAKTLRRSWFFRLFSLGALFILTIFNIGFFSPIGDEPWEMVSIPSSVPLMNLYLLNIGQAIIVIFLAADFLKRDKKLDTNEVLYTRSMSNFEYIIGKTWGILRLFLGLDILILSVALLMNIISKVMTIDILSYLWYLLILCVPTIIFSLGLAFMLMSVIRNQAVTFLILLGFAALNIFWLWHRAGSIFDYMAFGLPVFKSGVIGFDNLSFILNQRFIFLFLGLALVLATVLLFKRLPQSRPHTAISVISFFIFLAGAGISVFNTLSSWKKNVVEKQLVIETNKQFEDRSVPAVTDVFIDFDHKGSMLEASARLKFLNESRDGLDSYIFSLNPGLTVSRVSSNGKDLTFRQINHIVEIDPGKTLETDRRDSIVISYSGSINEAFCYPHYTDNPKTTPYRIFDLLNVSKRQAFLTDKYVLLTPEAHWYPVAGLNYYPSNPARIKVDFANYTLRVRTGNGMVAVSQGTLKNDGGTFAFSPESPLTGLTLAIGDYRSDTLKVDSLKYIACYFTGHDFYKKELSLIGDTLSLLVSGIMRELETNFSTRYPFRTLTLLEVPVQFYSYPKLNTQTRAELQPSMILVPEKLSTLIHRGFYKLFSRQKKNMARQNQVITDKELQVRIFNNFVRDAFISGENYRVVNGVPINEPTRYRLGPSFYFFKNNFYSSEYPVINAAFESHLQKVVRPEEGGFRYMMGGLSDNDWSNLILKSSSFREILSTNPSADTLRRILTIKGDYLFNLLRAEAGIEEFNRWFIDYIDRNKFTRIDISKLNSDIRDKFGFEFYPYLNDWFKGKDQPGFLFTDIQVNEIVVGDRVRYQVTFTASNPESVAGLFNVSFRTGGQGGGGMQMTGVFGGGPGFGGSFSISMQGRGMETSGISRIIFLGPGEAKKISIVLDAQPRDLLINTLCAKNIPGELNFPLSDIKKSKNRISDFTGEEKLTSLSQITDPYEKIVDNEDPGFDTGEQPSQSPLKRLLGIKSRRGSTYQQIRLYMIPDYWQPVVQSYNYGKYILSSVYTRSGTGDKSVKWTTPIDESGLYNIYCYIGKSGGQISVRTGSSGPPPPPGTEQRGESPYQDMHYKIYHDQGMEEITVDYENAEAGWNNLGRYYISSDSAKVELTNQSAGRVVIGDAIKWVKAE